MKFLLLLCASTLFINSCNSNKIKVSSKVGKLNITNQYEFEYQNDYSLACNVCFLEDTLDKVNIAISPWTKSVYADGKFSKQVVNYEAIKEFIPLKIDISKNLLNHLNQYRKSNTKKHEIDEESIFKARAECIKKFGFFKIEDSYIRDSLLLVFDYYSRNYVDLPIYNGPVDTSTIPRTPSGDYISIIRGDSVIIPLESYKAYTKNSLTKYNLAWSHVFKMRAQIVKEINGLDLSEMTEMQKILLNLQLSEVKGRLIMAKPKYHDETLSSLRKDLNDSFYQTEF